MTRDPITTPSSSAVHPAVTPPLQNGPAELLKDALQILIGEEADGKLNSATYSTVTLYRESFDSVVGLVRSAVEGLKR